MKRLYILAMFVAGALCGCSKQETEPAMNDGAIALMPVVERDGVPSRALLYDDDADLRADLFHTYSYIAGTSTALFDSDVKYSTEDVDATKHRWLFYDVSGGYKNYYWPLATSLDFFASTHSEHIKVNSQTNPPTFTATLPLINTGNDISHQENMKEFMYAYTSDRKATQGAVPLKFQHPFSGVVFEVKQSQRDLTVKTITIGGINHIGTFDLAAVGSKWDYTADRNDLVLTVEKIIPGDVNFGGELCGPYIVLPQANSSDPKEFSIECHWKGYDTTSDDPAKDTKVLKGKIINDWEPGHIYTYTLDLGNSREEILFQVKVTPWKYVYEHEFEIE